MTLQQYQAFNEKVDDQHYRSYNNFKRKGEDVLLPLIQMIPTDMPFEIKRLKFPVRLAFEITINKAQG